jgi:hypothetical protein
MKILRQSPSHSRDGVTNEIYNGSGHILVSNNLGSLEHLEGRMDVGEDKGVSDSLEHSSGVRFL